MKCRECGIEMNVSRPVYQYVESGLPNVFLRGVELRTCPGCGTRDLVIPGLARLHRALTLAIARKKTRLTGPEIRFLRKTLGWSGEDFARIFGVSPSTVSRWEHEKDRMGPIAERLLRILAVREEPIQSYPTEQLAEVAQNEKSTRFEATISKSVWLVAEAA